MESLTSPVRIIDQHHFNKYAAAWAREIGKHRVLTHVFQQPEGGQLLAVRFPFETLVCLMSTVGARRIKAQFLLKDDEADDKRFALALYATDASDGRISAYFLADYLPASPAGLGDQIPHELVSIWLANWKQAKEVTADMFSSNYGPLLGYTFEVVDFLDPLFYSQQLANKELRVNFALHAYYPAFPDPHALKQTFGLALRMYSTDPSGQSASDAPTDDPTGEPFFDLSSPYPPGS